MIYTQMMQSIDIVPVPQEGVGSIALIKVGKDVWQVQNLGKTKFLKTKQFAEKVFMNFRLQNHQNFSKVKFPSESISLCEPFTMYYSKVVYTFKNGIFL